MSWYYNDWGNALSDLAKIKQDENLFDESFEKYSKAAELNPKNDSIYNNWGTALSDLAKIKQDENLFDESFEKYSKAAELNPKKDSIYNNWGNTLSHLAKMKQDENLFQEAEQILFKGVNLGGKIYNLSCLYALRMQKEKALELLEKSLQKKEITIEYLNDDPDWDFYKEDTDFLLLLKKYNEQIQK